MERPGYEARTGINVLAIYGIGRQGNKADLYDIVCMNVTDAHHMVIWPGSCALSFDTIHAVLKMCYYNDYIIL